MYLLLYLEVFEFLFLFLTQIIVWYSHIILLFFISMRFSLFQNGYTFVELIITITIVSILATIGMISYGKYNSSARDTTRAYNINQILSVIHNYRIENTLDPLETSINYTFSWSEFATQWQLTTEYLSKIWFFWDVYDEELELFPSIFLTIPRQDFQLLTFFENYSESYTSTEKMPPTRYPWIFWKKLWILMDTESLLPLELRDGVLSSLELSHVLVYPVRSFLNHQEFIDTQNLSILPQISKSAWNGWGLQNGSFVCTGEFCN